MAKRSPSKDSSLVLIREWLDFGLSSKEIIQRLRSQGEPYNTLADSTLYNWIREIELLLISESQGDINSTRKSLILKKQFNERHLQNLLVQYEKSSVSDQILIAKEIRKLHF